MRVRVIQKFLLSGTVVLAVFFFTRQHADAATFVNDTFTGSATTNLTAHTGETGATWAQNITTSGSLLIDSQNRVRSGSAATTIYYASGAGASAEYDVEADIVYISAPGSRQIFGIHGRYSTGANTGYIAWYDTNDSKWHIFKEVAGSATDLGTPASQTLVGGTTYHVKFQIRNSSKKLFVDGVEKVSTTNDDITTAGKVGIVTFGTVTDNTGFALDNFTASDPVTVASSYTFTGPSSGVVNQASTNFTITPDGTYTGTITPGTTGSGTFTPSSLSYSSESSAKTFTYTPSSTSGSPHTISVSSSPSLTDPSSIAYTVSAATTAISIDNANWFWSPYTTYLSGSSYALMLTPGAYSKVSFTGTAASLNVNTGALETASINSANYPKLIYKIDGGATTTVQLSSTTPSISVASGLSSGTHTLFFEMSTDYVFTDHWTTPVSPVKITGLTLDDGASLASPTLLSKRAVFYGDSITGGYDVNAGTNTVADNDASKAYVPIMATYLRAEYGQIGYGGQGWLGSAADGTTPGLTSTWNNYYNSHSRLVSSSLSPTPDYIFVNMGTNGGLAATSTIITWLGNVRAAAANSEFFVMVPFGGGGRTNITAGVNEYKAAHLSDTKLHVLDLGSISYATTDGVHPTQAGHGVLATALNRLIADFVYPISASPTSITANSTGNSITLTGASSFWTAGTPGSPTFSLTGGTGASITAQTVTDSTHATLTLSAGSAAGTLVITDPSTGATTTVTVGADATVPTVSMTAPSDAATVSGSSVTLSATASDNVSVSGVQFKLDTNTNIGAEDTTSAYSVSWDSTAVADGSHTLIAVARDAAGNRATSTAITVTVDNTGPVISSISSGTPSTTGATVTWTTNEAADSQIEYGLTSTYTASTTLDNTLTTSHSVSLSALTPNTTYHFRIITADALGHSTNSADQTFTTAAEAASDPAPTPDRDNHRISVPRRVPTVQSFTGTFTYPLSPSQSASYIHRDLEFGLKGEDVGILQKILIDRGYLAPGNATGYFGPLTRQALIRFQKEYMITPSVGYFGPKTKQKISELH